VPNCFGVEKETGIQEPRIKIVEEKEPRRKYKDQDNIYAIVQYS